MNKQHAADLATAAGRVLIGAPACTERAALSDALAVALGLGFVGPEAYAASLRLLDAGGSLDVAAALVPMRDLGWRWLARDLDGGRGFANVSRDFRCSSWTAGDATVTEEEGVAARHEAATPALALAAATMMARAAFLRDEAGPRRSTQWHDGSGDAQPGAEEETGYPLEAIAQLEPLMSEVRERQRRAMERMVIEDAGGRPG